MVCVYSQLYSDGHDYCLVESSKLCECVVKL